MLFVQGRPRCQNETHISFMELILYHSCTVYTLFVAFFSGRFFASFCCVQNIQQTAKTKMLYIIEAARQEHKMIMFDFLAVVVAAAHLLPLSWLWTLQVSAHSGVYPLIY